jgi:hypothetical protein
MCNCVDEKLDGFMLNLGNYPKGSTERSAFLQGHKEANEYLLVYINNQENQEAYADLKQGAECILKAIEEL